MIASTNHFMAILAHGSPTGRAIYIYGPRLYEARSKALQVSTVQFLSRWSCGLS